MRRARSLARVAAPLAALVLAMTACGDDDDDTGSGSAGEVTTTRAGTGATEAPGATDGSGAGPTSADANQPDGAELVLGSFGPMSGPFAELLGTPTAEGLRAWEDDVNARGGIGGHPVRVIIEDDQGDPTQSTAIIRKLVEEDGIAAFIHPFPLDATPLLQYANDNQVPIIGGIQSIPAAQSEMFFPSVITDHGFNLSDLAAMSSLGDATNLALLYPQEASAPGEMARQAMEAAAAQFGVELVHTGNPPIATPDFTATVLAARDAGADAISTVGFPTAVVLRIAEAARRQGYEPLFIGDDTQYEEAFVSDPNAEGWLLLLSVRPADVAEALAPYRDAMDAAGSEPTQLGAGAWTSGKLAEALADHLDGEPTRETVLQALLSLDGVTLEGLAPPLTFGPGTHENAHLCSTPVLVEGGEFTFPIGERFLCAEEGGGTSEVDPTASS